MTNKGAQPVSQFYNVFGNSADAMAAILPLHFPTGTILDVNWGHGVFYKNVTGRDITGVDIRPPAKIIADNRNLPFENDSYDIGVLDPPYKRGKGNVRYEGRYGVAPCTEPRVTKSYYEALPELLRVCRAGIIVKCQDAGDGHAFYARHAQIMSWMKENTGLDVHDIAVVARSNGVPNANTQGKRRYFQQALSYFLIWKWRSKNPFKPVRF
jgi:DNA modification methylase